MMLLIALIVLFVSLLFLIFDSLRTEQRRKKVALYIGGDAVRAPSRVNRFFVRFGKEHRHELEQKLIEYRLLQHRVGEVLLPCQISGARGCYRIGVVVGYDSK